MLYTEATLNEIHRYCSLVPFSVYHSALEDTSKYIEELPYFLAMKFQLK